VRAIRVALADDDTGVREALTQVLGTDPRFTVVGAVADGRDLARLVVETEADLVVLDVRMPHGGPAAAAAVLTATGDWSPAPAIVALTAQSDAATVVSMLRAGAVCFLVKGTVGADLPDLLARVAGGEVVLAVPSGAEALKQVLAATS
jgi:DNA-binding NarL/FixJ family response regulator